MEITVREITQADFAAWDTFVRAHPKGTFCHLSGWKTVVETGAGQQSPYLVAEQNNEIVGVLPLTLRNSLLFGKALTSSMFAVYGGPLANSDMAYEALDAAAWQKVEQAGLDSMSYKSVEARHYGANGWTQNDSEAATFLRELKPSPDDILLDIPRKQRAVVRKSLKNGLTCSWGCDVSGFYGLHAASVRNLGTPVFPRKLFEAFVDVFGDDVDTQIIKTAEGRTVASLMSFYYKDTVLPYYAGGTPEARRYGAHDYMYYQLMVRAAERGIRSFDFGRSKVGSGPYKFKKNWGFEPTALEYEYRSKAGAERQDLSPTNQKFEMMVKLWKKLPLPIANILGPPIARHLG